MSHKSWKSRNNKTNALVNPTEKSVTSSDHDLSLESSLNALENISAYTDSLSGAITFAPNFTTICNLAEEAKPPDLFKNGSESSALGRKF